jgi:hypothetical protein
MQLHVDKQSERGSIVIRNLLHRIMIGIRNEGLFELNFFFKKVYFFISRPAHCKETGNVTA